MFDKKDYPAGQSPELRRFHSGAGESEVCSDRAAGPGFLPSWAAESGVQRPAWSPRCRCPSSSCLAARPGLYDDDDDDLSSSPPPVLSLHVLSEHRESIPRSPARQRQKGRREDLFHEEKGEGIYGARECICCASSVVVDDGSAIAE